MTTIIISGMGGKYLITQGYVSASSTGGDSSLYYYRRKPIHENVKPLLIQIKSLLEKVKGEK